MKNILILMVLTHVLHGTEIIVPPPAEMLVSADVVAVAKLSKSNAAWSLTLGEVLKGEYRPGEIVGMSSPYSEEVFSFDYLARLVGNSDFLFVGKRDITNRKLQPTYGTCSAWPQGTMEVLLPQRTLPDALAFAKKSLGLSDHKSTASSSGTLPPQSTEEVRLEMPAAKNSPPYVQPPTQKKDYEANSTSTPSKKTDTSMLESIMVALIVMVTGLLWLLLKRRK